MEAKILIVNSIVVEVNFYYLFVLPLLNKLIPLISVHCDSQVSIYKVSCKTFNAKKRHIWVRHKFIRNL